DNLLLMGRVGKTHGVRGEIKVAPETDGPERFADLEVVHIGKSAASAQRFALEGVRFQYPKGRTTVLLALEGVDSVEAAADLRGSLVWADPADLPALEDGEAFLHDLVGLTVIEVDDDGAEVAEIGTVRDLYDGAQLLFAVDRPGKSEVLIPDVDEFVVRTDLEARRLYVKPIEGLLE
ncbi:ribosome maturation factor RimM, partial [Rubrivirga sp.]|uniref:ribosome maturation factor RimM n=1 Tax=Rubrivirga sp. TaxID=1885344 RepID=UPI003C708A7E